MCPPEGAHGSPCGQIHPKCIVILGEIAWHGRLIKGMVPARFADDRGLFIAFPESAYFNGIIAVAQGERVSFHAFQGPGADNGKSLGFVDFTCRQIKDLISLMPPFLDPPAARTRGQVLIGIVGLQKVVYPGTPACSAKAVARHPSVCAVYLIDNEPYCQRPAVSPTGYHISIQLLLVTPCLFAAVKVPGITNKLVGIGLPAHIAATPYSG